MTADEYTNKLTDVAHRVISGDTSGVHDAIYGSDIIPPELASLYLAGAVTAISLDNGVEPIPHLKRVMGVIHARLMK